MIGRWRSLAILLDFFKTFFPRSHNVVAPCNPTNPQPSAEHWGMTPRLINFRTGNPTGHYKLDLEPWFHIAELGGRPMAGQSMLAIFPPKLTFWECNFAPQRFMQAKKDRDWWRYVVPYFSLAKTTIVRKVRDLTHYWYQRHPETEFDQKSFEL